MNAETLSLSHIEAAKRATEANDRGEQAIPDDLQALSELEAITRRLLDESPAFRQAIEAAQLQAAAEGIDPALFTQDDAYRVTGDALKSDPNLAATVRRDIDDVLATQELSPLSREIYKGLMDEMSPPRVPQDQG